MRAEFTAVIEGLRAMRLNDDGCRKVIVYSDCKGVVEACNGGIERRRMFGWRHTKNCDLWKLLEYEVSWWGDRLDVKHVYAHTKTIGWKATFNERVDLMAKDGARKGATKMKVMKRKGIPMGIRETTENMCSMRQGLKCVTSVNCL